MRRRSSGANVSLMNEMELSDSERSLNASRRPFSQIDEEEAQDEIECDNPEGILGAVGAKGEVKEVRRERDEQLGIVSEPYLFSIILKSRVVIRLTFVHLICIIS